MLFRMVSVLTAAASCLVTASALAASAAPTNQEVAPATPANTPDSLAGHFVVGAGLSLSMPHGKFGKTAVARNYLGDGVQVDGDFSLGLSRYVAAGLSAQWSQYPAADGCKDCSAQAFAIGPHIRYHLVQGTRFDPWLSAAIAYRWIGLTQANVESDFAGADLLALRVGGDWYMTHSFGIGPFLALDAGVLGERPKWAGHSALYWKLTAGARFVFDHPGKQ